MLNISSSSVEPRLDDVTPSSINMGSSAGSSTTPVINTSASVVAGSNDHPSQMIDCIANLAKVSDTLLVKAISGTDLVPMDKNGFSVG